MKDGPQVGDTARVDEDGYLHVIGSNGKTLRDIHPDNTWPELTPARVVPVTATPVTLTEDQALALRAEVDPANRSVPALPRELVTKFANAVLAQYAAPAEGEPIDVADVREGDRVRLVLDNGDEATFTVRVVSASYLCSRGSAYNLDTIRTIHLLHREEA